MCEHNRLEALEPVFAGINVNVEEMAGVKGMFCFKKYRCVDCGKIVTILNAVVSEEK